MNISSAKAADDETQPEAADAAPLKRMKQWLRALSRGKHHDNSLKEALEEVLVEHGEESTSPPTEEESIIKNVLEFSDLAVRDIMTPRTDIKAVEYNVTLDELKAHIAQNAHTRVPVYNDTLDNIKGFIHIKDLVPLLTGGHPFNMALILRDILFVPPSMKLISLLRRMRVAAVHMAIVVDEYGGTDGLVTLEDLFEEIVGEIQDEHDDEEGVLSWSPARTCDVDARMRIEQLDRDLGLHLAPADAEEDFETVAGLVFRQLGRVPAKGEIIEHGSGARFEILAADARRIQRIRIYAPWQS